MTELLSGPTVSVVIPTCDRPEFLDDAIESALAQTHGVLEVIVVDDASQVEIAPILARFGSRVRYKRLPVRSGANVARNAGVDLARGTFVGFLDDDDMWEPTKIAVQLDVLADTRYEACLCRTVRPDRDVDPRAAVREVDATWLRDATPCGTSGLLVRRDVVASEPFDPSLPRAQDWDMFVRLARRGPLAIVPEPLYRRRTGHDSITTSTLHHDPADLLAQTKALSKHRAWLGETAYRRRVARVLLSYIARRPNKPRFIAASLRHAGLRATVAELRRKTIG